MRSIEWWHCRWPSVPPTNSKPPHFLHFAPPFIAAQRVNLETSNLVHWWPLVEFYTPCNISATAIARDFKFCTKFGMWWVCVVSGRGQGHVSNFLYIVDLENFATASRRYTGDIHNSVRGRFVYDTYRAMEATRSRHGLVHVFITRRPTVTLQLYNFDLFRTCRRSSFCTVVWQQDFNWHDASVVPRR